MEDKLTSSSDMFFANVLNNLLSGNCNLVKKINFLTMNCLRDRTVKNDIHSCGPHPSKCIMEGCRSSVCTSVYPSQKAVHKKFKFDGNIPRFTFN